MTTEVIWNELNCPMINGLCERSACAGSTCGITRKEKFYDKEWEETEQYDDEEGYYDIEESGWWIFKTKEKIRKYRPIKRERKHRYRHFCKEIVYSYITCTHHQGQNLGIKITVKDIDEKKNTDTIHIITDSTWDYGTHGWAQNNQSSYKETEFTKFDERLEFIRNTINRDCIYDS